MTNPKYEQVQIEADLLTSDEKLKLALHLMQQVRDPKSLVKPTDLSRFFGAISFPEDALEYQQRVRAEWER
jgi:hypothetical protein